MEIAVIGKHPSVESYPPEVFNAFKHTLGLNHAAITFNTQTAFWMQIDIEANKEIYQGSKIVTVPKPVGARYVRDHRFEEIGYTHKADSMNVPECVRRAWVEKDLKYEYASVNTCLHVAIFWCMIKGYSSIHLFGCNNTPVEGGKDWNWQIAAKTTQEIIDVSHRYQVRIHWWKDYDQFEALAHKPGCLHDRVADQLPG